MGSARPNKFLLVFCLPDAHKILIANILFDPKDLKSRPFFTFIFVSQHGLIGYQRGSPCQDPAGNRTTRKPSDHRKEAQTALVWSCLPLIRSGKNHLARYSKRGKKTRQTEEGVGRQHQGINRRAWSSPNPRGQWRTGKRRKLVAKSSVVPKQPSWLRNR